MQLGLNLTLSVQLGLNQEVIIKSLQQEAADFLYETSMYTFIDMNKRKCFLKTVTLQAALRYQNEKVESSSTKVSVELKLLCTIYV